jgi:hypothetical protein
MVVDGPERAMQRHCQNVVANAATDTRKVTMVATWIVTLERAIAVATNSASAPPKRMTTGSIAR